MSTIMRFVGKYIRHGAAWLIGGFVAFVVGTLGVAVTEDQIFALTEGLTVLGVIILGIGYSFAEKGLKRFRWLDPEAWVERIWAKDAASKTEHTDKAAAEGKIKSGQV